MIEVKLPNYLAKCDHFDCAGYVESKFKILIVENERLSSVLQRIHVGRFMRNRVFDQTYLYMCDK